MTIDYTKASLDYRVRKVLRYSRLYGVDRTIEKVRGQYHMKADGLPLSETWVNPNGSQSGSVGIIGCGNFAFSNIAYFCHKKRKGLIRAAYDIVGARSKSLIQRYKGKYAAADPEEIFSDPGIKTVFIASNHASHTEFAIPAIKSGKRVHIEKPHVISSGQLKRLIETSLDNPSSQIFLGFNRPNSLLFRKIQQELSKQHGPTMINWFIAGHELDPDHWYFSEQEGGRILGNLCHWTDMTLRMIGLDKAFPITVSGSKPEGSESDFAITMLFGEGSVGMISFSAKGHTFEGVREYLNVHKGDALISLRDFHCLDINVGFKTIRYRPLFRDHGHGATIFSTLDGQSPESLEMVNETARLFLAVKEAVDQHSVVRLEKEDSSKLY